MNACEKLKKIEMEGQEMNVTIRVLIFSLLSLMIAGGCQSELEISTVDLNEPSTVEELTTEVETSAVTESENGPDEETENSQMTGETKLAMATLGSGCFWCTEADFDKVDGVIRVRTLSITPRLSLRRFALFFFGVRIVSLAEDFSRS